MTDIYQNTSEKLNKLQKYEALRRELKVFFHYWLFFFCVIVYWELSLHLIAHHTLAGIKGWFLLFSAAQAFFPAALSGWQRNLLNRIVMFFWTVLLFLYYFAQLIYYKTFGSLFSVSMIGMGGDAVENFGWSIAVTVRESLWGVILFSVPVLLVIAWFFLRAPRAERYRLSLHLAGLFCAGTVWLWSVALLRLGGTSDSSAYHAYSSPYTDTDTSSEKLGALTTSLVEIRSIYFGGNTEDLGEIISNAPSAADISRLLNEPEENTESHSADLPAEPENPSDASESAEADPPEQPLDTSSNIIESLDFETLAESADTETRTLCEYFSKQEGTSKNKYTGMFEGYNLIYICAEAFSNFAVSEEITPTLYKLSHEGFVLNNFYNSFPNTTTNGEFAFMTGLWPDVSRLADSGRTTGSFGSNASNYMPFGLGNLFAGIGVNSYAYHNYYGSYYSRNLTHPNLGYICRFAEDMDIPIQWPSSDLAMMEQTVDDYIDEEQFHAYYMTFSGHGPYSGSRNYITPLHLDEVPEEIDGRVLTQSARGFFSNQMELDLALQYLLQRLEEAGKLDRTLIVLVGDHYSYYLNDTDVKTIVGEVPDPDFEKYHSTCILWSASIEEPIPVDIPCCNVDILPTVLNLMGFPYDSRLLAGTDIFSDSLHVAILYNQSFVTDIVKYHAPTGQAIWLTNVLEMSERMQNAYVNSLSGIIKARYATSLAVNSTNFYRFAWEQSGFMTEEDILADDAKAQFAQQAVEKRIAEDAAREAAEREEAEIQAQAEAANPAGTDTQEQVQSETEAHTEGEAQSETDSQATTETAGQQEEAPAEDTAVSDQP